MSISIRGLQKLYTGSSVGLGTTDLEIPSSQWISIIGPSGCGKTTLLKLIAGLEQPTRGSVTNPLSKKDMSYVFQDSALLPWKTVMENIILPLVLRGVSRASAEADAQIWIQKLKLEKFIHHYPSQLSGGLKMRVSVARALITKPQLILMDEPFAALDEPIRIELGLELRELWKTLKPTIIFVTHSITEALWLSDRVLVLQGQPGRIALDRTQTFGEDRPLSLRGAPEFQKNVEECFQLLRVDGGGAR
jgi:NitT/TauT family transport system ATP-binding protein